MSQIGQMKHKMKTLDGRNGRYIYRKYSKEEERERYFVQMTVYCDGEDDAVPLRDRLVREVNLWIGEKRVKQAQEKAQQDQEKALKVE